MAEEVVVMEFLSDSMVSAGRKLIERLDSLNSNVQAAFWIYLPEDKSWKLMIISEIVKDAGPREFYKRIVEANKQANDSEQILSLNDIGVADTSDELVHLLKSAATTGNGISGIRLSRNTVNGAYIEDCYIYRMNVS